MAFNLTICGLGVALLISAVVSAEHMSAVKVIAALDDESSCPAVFHGIWSLKLNSVINSSELAVSNVSLSSTNCSQTSGVWKYAVSVLQKHGADSCSDSKSGVVVSVPRVFDYLEQPNCSDVYLGSVSLNSVQHQPTSRLLLSSLKLVTRSCVDHLEDEESPVIVIQSHKKCSQSGVFNRIFYIADSVLDFVGLKNNTFFNQINQEATKIVDEIESVQSSNTSAFKIAIQTVTNLVDDGETALAQRIFGDWSGVWKSLQESWHVIV